jgi:hypothetical protein
MTPKNPTLSLTVAPAPAATQQFVVVGTYNFGNPQDITKQVSWSSSDTTVVTIDKNGDATAMGSGRAFVTAQIQDPASGKTLQVSTVFTVIPQLTSITISPASATIAHGTTQQFIAAGNYNDKNMLDITSQVTWTSSQPAATISASPGTQGLATGVTAGPTTIGASLGTLSATPATLTVTNANLVSLAVSLSSSTVPLASSQQLSAVGTFDDGTKQNINRSITWATSDSGVAGVSAAGNIQGTGLGSATITATSDSLQAKAAITVDASSVSAVDVVPANKIATGTNQQMRAVATLKDGGSLEVTHVRGLSWSSSNALAASVDAASGLATANGAGSATIIANLGGTSGLTTLQVANASIQSLSVAPNNAVIAQQGIQNIVALGTFSDGGSLFQQDISRVAGWTSQDTSIATVSYVNGLQELAQGAATGTTNISASFAGPGGGSAGASVPLSVNSAHLSAISLQPGSAFLPLGGGLQFLATGNFSDGTTADLTILASWASLDSAIATVNPLGYAGANGAGQTGIRATFASQNGSSSLVINPAALVRIDICAANVANPLINCPPLDPFLPPPPISFAKQAPFGLLAIGTFSDGSRADLTSAVHWSLSAPTIATISNEPGVPGFVTGITRQGVVTGVQGGKTTIAAAVGKISGSTDVFVTDGTLALFTITPMHGTIALGTTQQLTAVGTFTDNTTQDLTPYVQWTTSDPAVAIVVPGGLVYSSGIGTATITASLNGAAGATTVTIQ